MIKLLAILVGLIVLSIGVIMWACIYVGAQSEKAYREELEREELVQVYRRD